MMNNNQHLFDIPVQSNTKRCALKLIPPEKQDEFRGEIGNVLQEQLDPEDLDKSLFEVVSLRNYAVAQLYLLTKDVRSLRQ